MRRWFESQLARLVADAYVTAWARAIAALPHDELSCHTTNWSVAAGSGSGRVQHRALPSSKTKPQLAQSTTNAIPPEQSERNKRA
jgi:hypothetical protein